MKCNLAKLQKGELMKRQCLDEMISFTLGKNPTRMKEQELSIYTPEDFERDLYCLNQHDNKSECIINLIKSKAAPVSIVTSGKCITSNFLKIS